VKAAARQDPGQNPDTPEPGAADEPGSEAGDEAGTPPDAKAVAQVREEAERRLADARSAIERERERRIAAEQALEASRDAGHVEGDAAELVRRRDEAVEAEQTLREERERWEETADRQAERRARELAEAERRITEARQAPAAGSDQPEAMAATPNGHPESGAKRRWTPLRRHRGSPEARECTVCGRGREAGQGDWVVTEQAAVCDSCRSDGWTVPKGGRLPVRRAARPE